MANHIHRSYRASLLGSSALLALIGFSDAALAQAKLPEVEVTSTRAKPKPHPVTVARPSAPVVAPLSPAEQVAAKNNAFDQSRSNLYTTIGTTSSTQTHATIDALPQGTNATVEKVLLQAPGVSQDFVASGFLHVRNDHANVQYRINGVILPDGIAGFGSILSTSWIGSIALVTGALPAEFGLRTIGLVDITTRADVFNNSGSVSLYGGSRGTITPSFEYGGTFGGNCPATSSLDRDEGSALVGPARTAFPASSTSSPAVICRPRKASKIRRRRSTRSMISRTRKMASPTCRPSSTRQRA